MFTEGEIEALVERALREGRINATKSEDFREALRKGHIPFFNASEIKQAAQEGKIPNNAVAELLEVVNRPDIAMFDPETHKRDQARQCIVWDIRRHGH